MNLVVKCGIPFLEFEQFKGIEGVFHAFTTRKGGVSQGPFASLNLALNTDDNLRNVLRNRETVLAAFGWQADSLTTPIQIHGNTVLRVTGKHKDKGAVDPDSDLRGVDGLITNEKGILLMIKVADCFPLYLCDPVTHSLGLIHAGWRGTAAGIVARAITNMTDSFGSKPKEILAGIGPGINGCCFHVEEDVVDAFGPRAFMNEFIRKVDETGKWSLDLKRLILSQLQECGLTENHVEMANECTSCNREFFFSYRRDNGRTGRMVALIGLWD